MQNGNVVMMTSFTAVTPNMKVGFKAPKDKFAVFILIGQADKKAPETFDPNEALRELGWKPESESGVEVFIREMKTSANGGTIEYWVVLRRNGKETTPQMFVGERYKAEYTAAEYDYIFNDKPEPDILAFTPETERTHGY